MPQAFEPLTLEGREEYLGRWAACPQKASDYSFGNIWGWREEYGLEWAFGKEHVWLLQTRPHRALWAPVGPWDRVDWTRCPTLAEGVEVVRVPQILADMWQGALGGRVDAVEARDDWDYVYSVQELIELRGNRFHRKKNLLSQFKRNYDFDYSELTSDCVEETLEMQGTWSTWRDAEEASTLLAENRAITNVLQNWDRLPGLLGGAIRVDGVMVAYTVAEALDDETLVIHFEKGRSEFKGVYQAINQMFLESSASGFSRVNREQDIGDEGLRKAKMSYNPIEFLKKYAVRIAPA
jgi:uncharacterized protein